MLNILFAARQERWPHYQAPLETALRDAGLDFNLSCDMPDEIVDYIVYAPNSLVQDFRPFTKLKAVMNLWAGVEAIVGNTTLNVPLTRMVDHGLRQGMTEWVAGHVLRHHLEMDRQILNQNGQWVPFVPPLAEDRKVTILGLGELGHASAQALAQLGFDITGWSRSPREIDGIKTHHGQDGLSKALCGADIVVLLLPMTPQTENIINATTIAHLAQGATIINPGRGPLRGLERDQAANSLPRTPLPAVQCPAGTWAPSRHRRGSIEAAPGRPPAHPPKTPESRE